MQSMKLKLAALAIGLIAAPWMAVAATFEQSLAKLAPEERAHEACALKGLETMRKDARLRKADRVKSSTLQRASLKGTMLVAKQGAVRAGKHWYALSFTCQLSPDFMKAQSFTFQLGAEIPKEQWEKLELWG